MAEVVVQAQSTLFRRQGSQLQAKRYTLPAGMDLYFDLAGITSQMPAVASQNEHNHLDALVTQNEREIPGGLTLFNIQDLDPSTAEGLVELQNIYQQDPWSSEYETQTQALYERSFEKARAAAQSGQENVRGGTARQAFELAELDTLQSINRYREVWQNQLAMAGVVVQATQAANAIQNERYRLHLQAQQQQAATEQGRVQQKLAAMDQLERDRQGHIRMLSAIAEFRAVPAMESQELYEGEGFQGGINTGFGMSHWR